MLCITQQPATQERRDISNMQITSEKENSEILAYVKSPPPQLKSRLQRFYSHFDGVDIVLGDWFSPRLELPHLLLLDVYLRRVNQDRLEWVDGRVPTLSIAQHIIVNDNERTWNPLNEKFGAFLSMSEGRVWVIRQQNDAVAQLWFRIQGEKCYHG